MYYRVLYIFVCVRVAARGLVGSAQKKNNAKKVHLCAPFLLAPPVGLEPRPFAPSIQFRRTFTAHFLVLRHNPPCSLNLPLAAVATRFPLVISLCLRQTVNRNEPLFQTSKRYTKQKNTLLCVLLFCGSPCWT